MAKKNVFIVSLEPIDTRYTAQWYKHIPESLAEYADVKGKDINVISIHGTKVANKTTPGAFLDFAATNIWKSSQLTKISKLFQDGQVKKGDVFLYTDFWNPTVFQLKYMSELLNIPVKIVGIAHAGSYDPWDFLGRIVGDKPWIRNVERSLYECFDKLIFATQFHLDMFANAFGLHKKNDKLVRSGFPMEYFPGLLEKYSKLPKTNSIVFPHRMAPEKQLNIFKDLAKSMPEYEWIVCQEKKLTKDQYHKILGQSKIVFSANLQETLGIGCIEAIYSNSIPVMPNRLSYTEMYKDAFKYPSEWTIDWNSYKEHKSELMSFIRNHMENFKQMSSQIESQKKMLMKNFIDPKIMYEHLV